ncbi:MAG: hypothetical protein ABEI52_00450 [Halobacteriaceae archaeon]
MCGETIEEQFLDKIQGTYVDGETVCSACQSDYSMNEIKEAVKE